MDDLFPILLFIIFILGPIIEALKKKGRPPPQQRRPQPRAPQQRVPEQSSRTEEISAGTGRQEKSAATMVPDDLWEILTGQKRPPVLTTPQPEPGRKRQPWDVVYVPEEDEDEEADAEVVPAEDVMVETRRARVEAQSLETYERHPEPVIVSLEENIPTAAQRHKAFHDKVTAPPPVIAVKPVRPALNLRDRSELQRAFLMQEVFGRPKGLE